jgi:hypothetical protein
MILAAREAGDLAKGGERSDLVDAADKLSTHSTEFSVDRHDTERLRYPP